MIPFDVRLSNFLGAVAFAADEGRQRAVWVEKERGITSIVSVGEFYCQFFDDNDMDGFIQDELEVAPLNNAQKNAILEFRATLAAVEQLESYRDNDDAKTLGSPEWKAVVSCAKRALAIFAFA